MLIAKLKISYDRGLARNSEQDLGGVVFGRGGTTGDGKVIRGLGTHFHSKAAAEIVRERDHEAGRIRQAFRERFLVTPIDGLYIVDRPGRAGGFIGDLNPQLGIKVNVTEFELTTPKDLNEQDLVEWGDRIKRQLGSVTLGRKKEINEDGLRALECLSGCPVLSEKTGQLIKNLVGLVRSSKIDRIELKRRIETLDVEIEQAPLSPKRAPIMA